MRTVVAILFAPLLLAGCAAATQRTSSAHQMGALLDVSLCGQGSYVAQFSDDRILRLWSVTAGIKYAKVSQADLATLTRLVNDASLPSALSPFSSREAGRFCYGEHPFVVLVLWRNGGEFKLNQSDINHLAPAIRNLVHFVDQLTRTHFGTEFEGHRGTESFSGRPAALSPQSCSRR